jgi:tetratricopeptide (TPR) repeat protein
MIETLFQELQRDFKPKDLSNFILVRVGDFIRKTTQPQTAEVYYKEALSRSDQSHMFAAIFGVADVYSKGTSTQKGEAIKLLKRVIDDSDDSGEKEEALYLTASIHADNDAYDAAIATAKEYLETDGFRRYAVPCRMLLANSHDKAGRVDDALTAYQQVWISSMGTIRFSSPAMKRWMEILWDRDKITKGKSDRQYSYEGGYKYLKMTSQAVKKATKKEKEMWGEVDVLTKSYGSRDGITKMVEKEDE